MRVEHVGHSATLRRIADEHRKAGRDAYTAMELDAAAAHAERLEQHRDVLLSALKFIEAYVPDHRDARPPGLQIAAATKQAARDAIARAEGREGES